MFPNKKIPWDRDLQGGFFFEQCKFRDGQVPWWKYLAIFFKFTVKKIWWYFWKPFVKGNNKTQLRSSENPLNAPNRSPRGSKCCICADTPRGGLIWVGSIIWIWDYIGEGNHTRGEQNWSGKNWWKEGGPGRILEYRWTWDNASKQGRLIFFLSASVLLYQYIS